MKRILLIFALLAAGYANAQTSSRPKNAPLPTIPPAVGKQERTQFFNTQHILCATLVELDHGNWYVHFNMAAFPNLSTAPPNITSQVFYTRASHPEEGRAEAVSWATHFCRGTK